MTKKSIILLIALIGITSSAFGEESVHLKERDSFSLQENDLIRIENVDVNIKRDSSKKLIIPDNYPPTNERERIFR